MIRRPKIGNYYFTRSGLKEYKGKDRTKGHVFAPTAKGEKTIYYTQEEIEQGVVCNPIEVGTLVESKWGALQYAGYDRSRAKYVFQDRDGNEKLCTMTDIIQGNIGKKSSKKQATKTMKEEKPIEDFGRKAMGARKDLYKDHDIDHLTPQERERLLVKTKVIAKPDFEAMYKENNDINLCALRKILYDSLPSKANTTDLEKQKLYIQYLNDLWDLGMSWKTYEDAKRDDYYKYLNKKGYIERHPIYTYSWMMGSLPKEWGSRMSKPAEYMGSKYRIEKYIKDKAFLKSDEDKEKLALTKKLEYYAINQNAPIGLEPRMRNRICVRVRNAKWMATLPIPENLRIPDEEERKSLWTVAFINKRQARILTLEAKSEEEAQSIALEDYNKEHGIAKGTGTGRKKTPLTYPLEEMKRVLAPQSRQRRKDVAGKDFQKQFGLSGEFGMWLQDSERQESMNQAYDAFNDLALALGIEPKSISLGDAKLIIAFGSRGKGTAMAHYEADTNVINLTKMKGAGCVSHEWFHAIDYNIGQKAGCPISFTRTYEENPHLLPAPVKEAIDALIYKPNYVKTKFYKDAKKIDEMHSKRDSYGYWASTVELFARAGDSFVKDELKALGARNDYLCGKSQYTIDAEGTAINPTGEDAKRINDAFRKMIEYFKQKGWL